MTMQEDLADGIKICAELGCAVGTHHEANMVRLLPACKQSEHLTKPCIEYSTWLPP